METLGSHGWRIVFERIMPSGEDGDLANVMTVADFRFQLSSNGMLLSDGKFQALVDKIDPDGTGAISYDEFAKFFMAEEHELEIQSIIFGKVMEVKEAVEGGEADEPEPEEDGNKTGKQKKEKKDRKKEKDPDPELEPEPEPEKDSDEPVPEDDADGAGNTEVEAEMLAINVRDIWADTDDDGTGNLVESDVKKVLEAVGKNLTDKELAAAFKEMDLLSGGKDGEVNFECFAEWWGKQSAQELEQFAHLEFKETHLLELSKAFKRKSKELKELVRLMAKMPEVPGMPSMGGGGGGGAAGAVGAAAGVGAVGGLGGAAAAAGDGGVPDLGITIPTTQMVKDAMLTVRAALGRLSALSVFLCKSDLYGAFCMGAQDT
jgi:Ca2+-binding EF-hand superfamily protein